MSSDTNKLILKANLTRTTDLGFVGRFHHNFGFEDDLFDYLLDQKDMWGEKLFYVNEGQFSKWVEQGRHRIRQVPVLSHDSGFPALELKKTSKTEYQDNFGPVEHIDLKISKGGNVTHRTLRNGESVSLKDVIDRNALALNVGGCITAMKWLHYSKTSLLAVFILNSKDGLANVIKDPGLSVFPKKPEHMSHIKSTLQIWKYDVEKPSLTLTHVFDTTRFGVTSRLCWVPAKYTDSDSGVILGVFTDGALHFFDIQSHKRDTPVYSTVVKPSWTILVVSERKTLNGVSVPITAYDFLDHETVVVGTLEGAIAEYVLPESDTSTGKEEKENGKIGRNDKEKVISDHKEGNQNDAKIELDDSRMPSFLTYVSDSMITTICVADVNASKVMLINTATAKSFAIQHDQLRQGRVETGYTILTLQPLYHRTYRIFVYPDTPESIGYTFARRPQQKHSLLLKTELISTFHISEYLNHPFAIVGNIMGDVYAMNIGRKIFGMPKAHNKLVVPLKIWTLYRDAGDAALTLSGDYIPVTPDRTEVMCTFTPPEVAISASAWNENFEGSSTYAFGTYTGLLVLERLDPVLV